MSPVLEALVIAVSMLVLFVVMSQALSSLMERRVPIPFLDEAIVQPAHRRGLWRPIGIVWCAALVVLTEGGAIAALAQSGEASVRIVYAVELILAGAWAVILTAAGRTPRARPDR
jgi:quinol-cytochrome oxidoreductase complex cytochrome b subunit